MADPETPPDFADLKRSFYGSMASFARPVTDPGFRLPSVHVVSLRKTYQRTVALQGIDFSVKKGEIFGLLGSNGAGKSTTIKILAGLLRPTSGQVFVEGINVREDPIDAKARLGYLPELPILYEHLTGREFLVMVGELRGMVRPELEKAIAHGAARLELTDFLDRQIGHYSKGTKQKTAFIMATLGTPPVLLMDEPSSGLDPRFNKIIKEWIMELRELHDTTILLSTHMTDLAESLCDRVAIIDRGRIVASGDIPEILKSAGAFDLEEAFVRLVEAGNSG